ncbi:MAG: bi-domain-containing oxidoreductase [Planctomycetota bacterium]
MVRPGAVLVQNVRSLVSAGTERTLLEFSKSNVFEKARRRPDLVQKVLRRVRNDGLKHTYQAVQHVLEQPVSLGYSSAGFVVAIGAGIEDLKLGQAVACAGYQAASHAEYASVPRNLLVPIPDGVGFDEAAFVAVGAIAMHAIRLADISLGDQVVVQGLGLVGMVACKLAQAAGATVIGIDRDPRRVDAARQSDFSALLAGEGMVEEIFRRTRGHGADKVLLCAATASSEPIETVPRFTRQKGVLVVVGDVGMNIPRRDYFEKEIDIRVSRSYGPGRYDPSYEAGGLDYPHAYVRWTENRNMIAFLDLLGNKRIEVESLITHHFDLHRAQDAYALIDGTTDDPYLGIVLDYPVPKDPRSAVPRTVRTSHHVVPAERGVLSLGVLGAGNFAKTMLLPAFLSQKGVSVRRICTSSGISAAYAAKRFGASSATSDPNEILESPDIDAVVIATRHDSHADYVLTALRHGKPVFVEKPLATTLDDLDAIREFHETLEEDGMNPRLMVGYNRRFSPLAGQLKEAFSRRSAPLSMLYRVNAGFVSASEWIQNPIAGGGRVIGECCHFVDLLTYLVGAPCSSVFATTARLGDAAIPDVTTLLLEFPEGSIGTVQFLSNGNRGLSKEYLEVHGGGLSATLDDFRRLRFFGSTKSRGQWRFFQAKGIREEAEAFVTTIRTGGPAPIPFDQVYSVSKTTLLASVAAVNGHRLTIDAAPSTNV